MPKCKICGNPVVSTPVVHPECWQEWAEERTKAVCDYACKWAVICEDPQRLRAVHCEICGLKKLTRLESALCRVLEL